MRRAYAFFGVSLLLAGLIYGANSEFSAMENIGRSREEGDYVRAGQNLEIFKKSIAGKIAVLIPTFVSQLDYEEAMIFVFSGAQKSKRNNGTSAGFGKRPNA